MSRSIVLYDSGRWRIVRRGKKNILELVKSRSRNKKLLWVLVARFESPYNNSFLGYWKGKPTLVENGYRRRLLEGSVYTKNYRSESPGSEYYMVRNGEIVCGIRGLDSMPLNSRGVVYGRRKYIGNTEAVRVIMQGIAEVV